MNKNNNFGKRQIRYYKRLIVKKMNELNIQDKIIFTNTGKTKDFYKLDDSKKNLIMDETGKAPKVFKEPVLQAVNPHRQLLRRLLNSTESAIQSFLNLKTTKEPENESK